MFKNSFWLLAFSALNASDGDCLTLSQLGRHAENPIEVHYDETLKIKGKDIIEITDSDNLAFLIIQKDDQRCKIYNQLPHDVSKISHKTAAKLYVILMLNDIHYGTKLIENFDSWYLCIADECATLVKKELLRSLAQTDQPVSEIQTKLLYKMQHIPMFHDAIWSLKKLPEQRTEYYKSSNKMNNLLSHIIEDYDRNK